LVGLPSLHTPGWPDPALDPELGGALSPELEGGLWSGPLDEGAPPLEELGADGGGFEGGHFRPSLIAALGGTLPRRLWVVTVQRDVSITLRG